MRQLPAPLRLCTVKLNLLSSLEEALDAGYFRVTEVSAEGRVPELRVKNSGDAPVLIFDGEELVGAKQNRIVNLTILVAPQSEIVISVSCIEAGRWGYSRPEFAAAGRVLNQEIRESKAEAVTQSLKERRRRHSDQGAVWTSMDATLSAALGAASATGALSDGFEKRADAIEDYLAAFKAEPGQVGLPTRRSSRSSLRCGLHVPLRFAPWSQGRGARNRARLLRVRGDGRQGCHQ